MTMTEGLKVSEPHQSVGPESNPILTSSTNSKNSKKFPSTDSKLPYSFNTAEVNINSLMETLQSLRQQVAGQTQDIQQRASSQLDSFRQYISNCLQNSANTLREYVNRYPPLAAFIFSLLVLSAIPITVYLTFAIVTSAVVLTIALIGFSIVEGTMLMAGGGILLAVLGGVGLFSLVTFGFISFIYLGYKAGAMIINQVQQTTGYSTFGQYSSHIPQVPSQQSNIPAGMTPMSR